jgi:hypothetical protein
MRTIKSFHGELRDLENTQTATLITPLKGATTFSRTTLSIMTFSIECSNVTRIINDIEHNRTNNALHYGLNFVMLNVAFYLFLC